jgi:hypothetical protein
VLLAASDNSSVFVPINPYLCRPPHAFGRHSNVVNAKVHDKDTIDRTGEPPSRREVTNMRSEIVAGARRLPNFQAECFKRTTLAQFSHGGNTACVLKAQIRRAWNSTCSRHVLPSGSSRSPCQRHESGVISLIDYLSDFVLCTSYFILSLL